MQDLRRQPTLVVLSGLPGTGKSTLAYQLASDTGWALLSRDQVDRSLAGVGVVDGRLGYEVLFGLADLNLRRSVSVILDACFSRERLRGRAREIAGRASARFVAVELRCSDEVRLRQRFATRHEMVEGWTPADWREYERVKANYEPWTDEPLALDAVDPVDHNYRTLCGHLRGEIQ